MDKYIKWRVGHFWQRILDSDKQASFIKMAGEPLYALVTSHAMACDWRRGAMLRFEAEHCVCCQAFSTRCRAWIWPWRV